MSRDSLTTLIKVRRIACDDAFRSVVAAAEAEDRAMRAANEIERALAQETEAASDPASPDIVVEAFGQFLARARRQLEQARRLLHERQAETTRKRAELTACKTALESVQALQEQRRRNTEQMREKYHQRELEERSVIHRDVSLSTHDEA